MLKSHLFEFNKRSNNEFSSVRVPVHTFFNRNNSLKIENNQMSARTAWARFRRCDRIELIDIDTIEIEQVGFN